jgi:hypothetical protein
LESDVKKEIKKLWVGALRSGEYKQTTGKLRDGDAFCCLGVLCNLHAQAHPEIAAKQKDKTHYMGFEEVLPSVVREWAGMTYRNGDHVVIGNRLAELSHHNDAGRSFEEIANAIEEQL